MKEGGNSDIQGSSGTSSQSQDYSWSGEDHGESYSSSDDSSSHTSEEYAEWQKSAHESDDVSIGEEAIPTVEGLPDVGEEKKTKGVDKVPPKFTLESGPEMLQYMRS